MLLGAAASFGLPLLSRPARAEAAELRIGRNTGLSYLPLYVAQEQRLFEKQAQSADLGTIAVTFRVLGSPGTVNDAVIAGGVDLGVAGITGLLTLWDRTRSNLDVRGLCALGSTNAYLMTTNPAIRALGDFTERDRIALPTAKVSTQAINLQMAAARLYGPERYDHFDKLTVSLNHATAVSMLLAARTELTAHFATPPYNLFEQSDARVHRVTTSDEILGGPTSGSAIWATKRFIESNPRLAQAALAAIQDAVAFIDAEPRQAAEIFVKIEGAQFPVDLVERIIRSPDTVYAVEPRRATTYSDFMHSIGTLKHKPSAWQDLFFPVAHGLSGS